MSCGAAVGLVLGKITSWLLNRIRLDYEGLYPVLSMSIVILAYGASESLGGNGFLAVYLCGVVLGNSDFPYKRSLMRFHDGLGWLMQIGMFLLLGLLVYPSHLPSVVFPGMMIALFLLVVARPVAVFIGLFRSGFHWRKKTLVAWAGLRGAVPIVLATFPLMAGYPKSEQIFNLVFFIVLASVLLQGKSLMMLARWLKLDESLKRHPRSPLEFDRTTTSRNETREFEVLPGSVAVGKSISEIGLPKDVLILLIRRGPNFVVPRGHTRLEPYDMLMVLAEPEGLHATRMRLLEQAPPPAEDPAEA
jgi:cell volume regulation protein A